MPIDEDKWENAVVSKSVTRSAQEFLEENHPNAYTPTEITRNIVPDNVQDQQMLENVKDNIIRRLDTVSAAGVVETRMIDENGSQVAYYRAVMD